jgi:hypothetical protein
VYQAKPVEVADKLGRMDADKLCWIAHIRSAIAGPLRKNLGRNHSRPGGVTPEDDEKLVRMGKFCQESGGAHARENCRAEAVD